MDNSSIDAIFESLEKMCHSFKNPALTRVSSGDKDPYKILIACILSLRTQDKTTLMASGRLFAVADNPLEMSRLTTSEVEQLIYPVGFYRDKARRIVEISGRLVKEYSSAVPDSIEELLKFRGVGRKTANLVVTVGYQKLGICVDTHVHRITNRWGYVNTGSPEETEFALRSKLPEKYWIPINDVLVSFGQNICKPLSPFCSNCRISGYCEKVGVERHR